MCAVCVRLTDTWMKIMHSQPTSFLALMHENLSSQNIPGNTGGLSAGARIDCACWGAHVECVSWLLYAILHMTTQVPAFFHGDSIWKNRSQLTSKYALQAAHFSNRKARRCM